MSLFNGKYWRDSEGVEFYEKKHKIECITIEEDTMEESSTIRPEETKQVSFHHSTNFKRGKITKIWKVKDRNNYILARAKKQRIENKLDMELAELEKHIKIQLNMRSEELLESEENTNEEYIEETSDNKEFTK